MRRRLLNLLTALSLLVCVALARAVAAANVRLLTSRKGRDLAVLSGLVVAIGAQVELLRRHLGERGHLPVHHHGQRLLSEHEEHHHGEDGACHDDEKSLLHRCASFASNPVHRNCAC